MDKFVSAVLQRKFDDKEPGVFEELAVEGSRGKNVTSWQAMESAGKRPVYKFLMWEYFLP